LILPPFVPENPTLALDLRCQASVSFIGLYADVADMIRFSSVNREREIEKERQKDRRKSMQHRQPAWENDRSKHNATA
jgi:hypothetical protein